jgi:hypothetical protein
MYGTWVKIAVFIHYISGLFIDAVDVLENIASIMTLQ